MIKKFVYDNRVLLWRILAYECESPLSLHEGSQFGAKGFLGKPGHCFGQNQKDFWDRAQR